MKSPFWLRAFKRSLTGGRSPIRTAPAVLRCEPLEERAVPATLDTFLTTEHVDINLGYSGGAWTLQNRNSDAQPSAIAYDPDEALLYAGTPSLTNRVGGAAFDFIGVGAGAPFYQLPQSQDPELLYLGFAAYGATGSQFDAYNPSAESQGRVSGTGKWLKVTLVDVDHVTPDGQPGTGQFSVWQSGDSGPAVFMSSHEGGITASDALWVTAGGHLHYNFGFTQTGRYEVKVKLSGYLGDDGQSTPNAAGFIESQPLTLYFSVGSVGELQFDNSTYTVNESAGTASVTVRRVGGSDGQIRVNYATGDGTATAGSDYTATSGTLTFLDGETEKTITIPITDDTAAEGAETVNLTLSAPGPASIQNYLIDFQSDPNGLLGAQSTAVLTIPANDIPNDPPTISNVADRSTLEGTPTAAIPFTVGDTETPAADLVVTATSSNPALVPAGGIALGGSGASRTVTLTPAAGQSGTTTITLTVTDAAGATATDTFVLTVSPVYTLPGETIPDVVMNADQSVTINYTVPSASLVTVVSRTNTTLFNAPGTSSGSDLRTQPTSGGTSRTLRIRPQDRSTSAGAYGSSDVTLSFTGTGAPPAQTFNVRVNPRAVADNNLLAIPGTTSTFDVLANDVVPLAGHTFAITGVTGAANGTVVIDTVGGRPVVRYTPSAGYTGTDTFTYTVTVTSADEFNGYTFTGTGYVVVGNYVVVDSPTSAQHTDIDINFVNGEWVQNIQTDAQVTGVESGAFSPTILDADEGLLFLDPTTKTARPDNSFYNFDFIGVPVGADIWLGPASTSPHKLYLGIANEETDPSSIVPYLTGDPRAPGEAQWVTTQLVGFSGPGHFSAFDFGDDVRVFFDTADGLNSASDADAGGNPTDTFFGFAGSHAHLNWVFTQPGRYALTFQSTTKTADGFTTSMPTTFYFDVDSITGTARLGEAPPQARPDTADTIAGYGPVTVDVLGNDTSLPDPNEVLTVTAVTQGANGATVTVAADGRSVSYTPAAGFSGTDSFTYTITDEHGGTATATVAVTVAANAAPTISAIADRFVVENTSTGAIAFTVGDDHEAAGDLIVTAVSSNTTAVPNANIVLGGSGASRTLTITPAAGQVGPTTVTVTVTDPAGRQATATFMLTVVANHVVPFALPTFVNAGEVTNSFESVSGDFNGDGKVDLIVAGTDYDQITFLQGTGAGGFVSGQVLNAGQGTYTEALVAVDYDGDGDLDLLAYELNEATRNGTANEGTITLYRNDGAAQFTRLVVKSGLEGGHQIDAGDLNGDGKADVVYGSSALKAFALQQPDGQLGALTTLTNTPYGNLQIGDVNGDGKLDVVTSGYITISTSPLVRQHELKVFLGNGDGTVGAPQAVSAGDFAEVQGVVDLNGDGRKDLLVYDRPTGATAHLGYYPQQADGSFGARVTLLPGHLYSQQTVVADVNNDSLPDVVSYSYLNSTYRVSWAPGLGGGAYGAPIVIAPSPGGTGLHVLDVDGDSHLDVVTVGGVSTTNPGVVSVYLNKTGENPMVLIPPAARTRVAGDPIDLQVYFGFPITVTGTPRVALDVGGNTVYANYLSGSGTATLTFRYVVTDADLDLDGVQLASNLIDLNGGTLTDPVGGAGVLEFPNLPFTGVVVNGRGPLVQSITRLDSGTTTAGTVRFAVQFAEDVTEVDVADFAVRMSAGDLAGAGIVSVTGSGRLYEVTVATGTGSGTLGLNVSDTASVFDLSGDVLAKGYPGGEVYTVRPTPVGNIDYYYVEGHADYRPVYTNGEFTYVWHGEEVRPSDEVITYLDSTAVVNRPAGTSYDFIGVGAGQPYYLSNSSGNIASVPFLGWSGESLVADTFADYRPSDPRITSATLREYVKIEMVGFRSDSGGDFSLYSGTTPTVWFATSDGIDSTDAIWLYRTHFHRNTAFSKPGVYEIDVVISGYLDLNANNQLDATDVYVESGVKTMVFHVDTLGARDDAFATGSQGPLTGDVTANDEWHEGLGAFTVSLVTDATNGTLALQSDGSFTYTPSAGFRGTDSFTYRLTNERGGVTTATATVTVNDAPAGADDAYQVAPDNTVRGNVLFNDTDLNGDTVTAVLVTGATKGSVVLNADGAFTYTPGAGFVGIDSFTYRATDGALVSAETTVTITAAGAQDFDAVLTAGHTDVGIAFEDGAWDLHVHNEENDEEYEPDGALLFVGPQALATRADGLDAPAFDFLGVAAGASFYRLPQSQNPELLYLGIGAEELEDGTFLGDTVTLRLKAVNGSGQFSLWRSGDLGPTVAMATSDGITSADQFDVLAGSHAHYNWGFSAKGRYEITFEALATLPDGTTVASGDVTYYFSVDNLGRVQFDPAAYTVAEGGSTTLTVVRVGGSDGPLTVNYGASGGSAGGADYAPFDGTLTFADGETVKTFTISAATDGAVEGNETVAVTLTAPSGSPTQLGTPDAATVTITDVVPPPGPPETPAASYRAPQFIVLGSGTGRVQVLNAADRTLVREFAPFAGYGGAVAVAAGDVDGDGITDVIAAAGNSHVKVFSGSTGAELMSFITFPGYAGAVTLAAGDVDGDGRADVVVGTATGNSHVKVIGGGTGAELMSFLAFPGGAGGFAGGVRVAAGDVSGDGRAEVVVVAGPGGNGHVKAFDRSGALAVSFLGYAGYAGEINVATGDADGDGRADIVTVATNPANGVHMQAFSVAAGGYVRSEFVPQTSGLSGTGAARVAVGDVTGDRVTDILLGSSPAAGSVQLMIVSSGAVETRRAFEDPLGLGLSLALN